MFWTTAESMYLHSLGLIEAYHCKHVNSPPPPTIRAVNGVFFNWLLSPVPGSNTIKTVQTLCVCILLSMRASSNMLGHSPKRIVVHHEPPSLSIVAYNLFHSLGPVHEQKPMNIGCHPLKRVNKEYIIFVRNYFQIWSMHQCSHVHFVNYGKTRILERLWSPCKTFCWQMGGCIYLSLWIYIKTISFEPRNCNCWFRCLSFVLTLGQCRLAFCVLKLHLNVCLFVFKIVICCEPGCCNSWNDPCWYSENLGILLQQMY